jgi:glucosylceramidase
VSASSSLTGYQTTFTSPPQQHVDFIDTNSHVQELVLDKGATTWKPNDLTALATDFATGQMGPPSVPSVASGSHLTGYPTTWNDVQHVVFTTGSDELYELYYLNNQWNGNSLTPLGFWPAAGSYSGTLQVEIRDQASGRTIHFTTDGSTPAASSPVYTGPITVSATTTIKVLATAPGTGASKQASATYTIAPGAATTPVAAVVTTNNGTHKMDPQSGVGFVSGTGSTNVIHVDETVGFQQIEGFGASFTDTSAQLLNQVASQSDKNTAMQNLFSPSQGIGFSFIRNPLGASDFALDFYTYDDLSSGTDLDLTHFTIAHDLVNIVPLVKQAKNLNGNLKIMANPWSPPAWMKTPRTVLGHSSLIDTSDNYEAFAKYLVKSIQAYAAQSINIDYISLQNEPLFDPDNYPGMLMDADKQAAILTGHVIQALRDNSLGTKVLIYDHNWNHPEYPQTVLSHFAIGDFPEVAGVAWHGYNGTADAMTTVHNQYPALGQYQTEHSVRITAAGTLMQDNATHYGDQTEEDFEEIITTMRNWAKSYVKWNLAENENNGPRVPGGPNGTPGGCKECTPILVVNSSGGAIWYSLQYYTMGHFSKFVRPGATRIDSNDISIDIVDPNDPNVVISKGTGLWNAAFLNTDGSKAMVVYNGTTTTNTFQVQWGSRVLTYSLPAKSGVTLTWNGTQN